MSVRSIAGRWNVSEATLPNGEFAYTGTISAELQGQTYQLIWDISAGAYVGIGIAHAEHVFVSCGERFDQLGIALYYADESGRPTGQWSVPELQGTIGNVQFLSPWTGSFEGEHTIVHHGPGQAETATIALRVIKRDAIYEVSWQQDKQQRVGLGIAMADGIAVGWYPDIKQLAFLDYHPDPQGQQLTAVWALGGFTTLGTETLTRI